LGVATGTNPADAVARMEATLDAALPGWRSGEVWRRDLVVDAASGAVAPPGTTWRDRPPIDQGDGRFLAGDRAAAPGLLSEVSVSSGVRAAHLAIEQRRQSVFAPGWPALTLTPQTRLAVLAQALPSRAGHRMVRAGAVDDVWAVVPAEETEPRFTVRDGRWFTVAAGASPTKGGSATEIGVLVGTRFRLPRLLQSVLVLAARCAGRRRVSRQPPR